MNGIWHRIKVARKNAGLTQEQLANKLGVSRQSIAMWEKGQCAPNASHVIALASALDVSVDYLLKGVVPV